MTKEDEAEVQRLLKNVDVTELMDMIKKHGNRYSRRILKFFRWFSASMCLSLLCSSTHTSFGSYLSIHVRCLSHIMKICLAIFLFISWFTSCRW